MFILQIRSDLLVRFLPVCLIINSQCDKIVVQKQCKGNSKKYIMYGK